MNFLLGERKYLKTKMYQNLKNQIHNDENYDWIDIFLV